ncbi:toxin TcdB middle/N-terminal domain-containing protein, partial [Desulfococcaceae bacterium HSG7]|nr:toxin TcdB middle/N-terminal domain-containing protein [Desulfococcaceae bacterium HSG7]
MLDNYKKVIIWIVIFGTLFLSNVIARETDPNYKFAGIKSPESPYKNTWSAFQTDLFSGSFSYTFNIDVPPGTNGLAPEIAIGYNSHSAKSRAGWTGMGWDIPHSYIQRDVEYTRKDTSDDTFDLYLNGSKHDLVYVAAEDRFHTRIESFLKIEKIAGAPNEREEYWLVTSKGGTQYRFGYNVDAEHIVATTDGNMDSNKYVWRWSLDQATDTNGNQIYYSYTEIPANGEVYLAAIEYNSDRKRKVEFILTDRADPAYPSDLIGSYLFVEQGSEIIETKKLSEIRITVNGQLSKKYVLAYKRNEAQTHLLLTSITQYGSDENTSLPPVKFQYRPLVKAFSKDRWYNPKKERPIRKSEEDGDVYWDTTDMNGDGRPDLVHFDRDDKEWEVWRNNKTGFKKYKEKWDTSNNIKYITDVREEKGEPTNTRSTMMDFNRDGYIDLVWADGKSDKEFRYVLNGPNRYGGIKYRTMPIQAWVRDTKEVKRDSDGDPKGAPNVKQAIFDITGDGYPDIVKRDKINSSRYNAWTIYRGNGDNFTYYDKWRVYHTPGEAWIEDMERDDQDVEVTTRDMNGDGLVDIIYGESKNSWVVFYNTGSHFRRQNGWMPPGLGDDDIIEISDHDDRDEANDTRRGLVDMNGDGLPDVVKPSKDHGGKWIVYLNRGNRFQNYILWPCRMNTKYVRDVDFYDDKSGVKRDMLDINGDGLPDIVKRKSDKYYWEVYINQSFAPDLLTQVTDTLGAKITVSYTSSMKYDHTRLPFNYWVVNTLTKDNGMTGAHQNISAASYTYTKGLYDFPLREFRGFGAVTEKRADGTQMIHYYHQDEALKGKEYRTELKSASNMPYARTDTAWTSMSPAADIFFPQLDQTDNFTFDGKADNPKQVRTAFQDYDDYGNVRTEIRYGDLSVNSDDFTAYREFKYDTERWIMDRVEHTYITDAGGAKLRENWSDFDADGNLIREEAWLDTGDNPVTQHDYDSYGNRILFTDPENNDTRTEYDTELNTFPVKTYNAKNQVVTRTFNLLYGQAETETDPNGHTTAWEFDTLGRKIKEIRPFDTSDRPTKAIEYHIDGTAPEYVKTSLREQSGADGTVDTYQIIDGFAALIQTRTEAEDSAYQVVTDVYYDKMDRVERQSNPYQASKTDGYGAPDENAPATAYEYDTPGRPVTVFNPDGTSIKRTFDHWTVTETDENGHATSYWFDAYQSLLQVQENNGNESYLTGYEYNPAGELINITDHYGNLTQIDYDTLGRKTAMDDPDMGAWAYGYDRNGNLVNQQDARGIVTAIEYDELNRKTLIDYPSDSDVRFIYDLTTVGVLSKTEDNAGTVTYQYDERLRKTAETRAMDGHTWTTAWQYDAMDRIFSMTYPDGEEKAFQYNSQGALESVPGIMPGINYNATGQITQKTYGNGLATSYAYHPANNRLTEMQTPGIQDFKYTYDAVGNVMSIQDGMTGQTETFGYDDLDRLTSAGDSEYQASYAYNAIGNMLAENMMGVTFEYTYGENAGPHAVTGKTMSRPVIASLHIENNAVYTVVPDVTLNIRPFGEPTHYMASEDPSFQGAAWLPYTKTPPFTLSD